MLKFTTTNKVDNNGIKLMVYGGAGFGKTVLCSTAPNPIILSAESGLLSLRRVNLPVIEITSFNDLIEAFNWCKTSHEASQFHTICLDSISEIAEVILTNEKKGAKDPRKAYGEMIEKTLMALKDFRDIKGKHIYMSAKMESVKDEATGIIMYGPSMPGNKLGPQLPYLFDEVFRLGISKDQSGLEYRFLQTKADMQYSAKDRSGALDALEPPDLTAVINKILGVF